MEESIKKITNGKHITEVKDIVIDSTILPTSRNGNTNDITITSEIKALLEEFIHLEYSSLSGIGLSSLEYFPHLPRLQRLNLSNNAISKGLHHLEKAELHSLVYLDLSFNGISKLAELEHLSTMEKLLHLNLAGCGVTRTPDYRLNVECILPTLRSLDQYCATGKEQPMVNLEISQEETRITASITPPSKRSRTGPPPQHGKLYLATEFSGIISSVSSTLSNANYYNAQTNIETIYVHDSDDETFGDEEDPGFDSDSERVYGPANIVVDSKSAGPSAPLASDTEVVAASSEITQEEQDRVVRMLQGNDSDDSEDDEEYDPDGNNSSRETEDEEEDEEHEHAGEEEVEEDAEEEEETEAAEEENEEEQEAEQHSPKRRRESTSSDGTHKRRK